MTDDVPLQISFRNIGPSPAIVARVRREAAKLRRLNDRIIGCRVVVSSPERRHRKGKLYAVRIQISMPGKDIWINRGSNLDHAHEDVYVAIRDAFAATVRRLEDAVRLMGGQVKHHDVPPHGRIRAIDSEKGFGFIQSSDGNEIYFHRNAVLNEGFDRLKSGDKVRFVIDSKMVGQNLHASTVRPIGKHCVVGE
jgi:cold shock CspA family protein/ribosome-associated translation inhibitor RaiA